MSDQETTPTEEAAQESEIVEATASKNATSSIEVTTATPPTADTVESEGTVTQSSEESNSSTETPADDDASSSIHNLKRGQQLAGKVKNITDFGAFVDIGLPQDGLVHISELTRKKVEKVTDVVSAGDEVDIWIKKIDTKRGRISLTMLKPVTLRLRDIVPDSELEGRVTRLEAFGAFIDIGSERDGLVHISQITHDYIKHPEEALTIGTMVQVKVLKVNRKKRQVDLSIKALLTPPPEVQKVEKVKKGKVVEAVEEVEPQEEVPTAMALAYEAMQNKGAGSNASNDSAFTKGRRKRKKEIEDIITRTLATSE